MRGQLQGPLQATNTHHSKHMLSFTEPSAGLEGSSKYLGLFCFVFCWFFPPQQGRERHRGCPGGLQVQDAWLSHLASTGRLWKEGAPEHLGNPSSTSSKENSNTFIYIHRRDLALSSPACSGNNSFCFVHSGKTQASSWREVKRQGLHTQVGEKEEGGEGKEENTWAQESSNAEKG